jgi:tetratricopeptide (TPR) repeat protein
MTPFEKTGQIYRAIQLGSPAKLLENALSALKNYHPNKEEELMHKSLLASIFASLTFSSLEPSDAIESIKLYEELMIKGYPLKENDWKNIAKIHQLLYEKTFSLENIEKGTFAALRAADPILSAKLLLELYLKVRSDDTFQLACENISRYLNANPENVSLLLSKSDLQKEYGLRSKEEKYLSLAINGYEKALAIEPENSTAQANIIVTKTFLALFSEDFELLCDTLAAARTITDDDCISLYAKGVVSVGYSIAASDMDEVHNAIHFLQSATSIDRTFYLGWHYLGICFYLVYEALEDVKDLNLAIKFFKKSLKVRPRAETYIQLAIATARLYDEDNQIEHLEESKCLFEAGLSLEKASTFPPAEWIFEYGLLLEQLGDEKEDESLLAHSLDQFNRVLILDPNLHDTHYRIAVVLSHIAELTSDPNCFMRAFCHFRLAHKNYPDHDFVLLDWGLALISFGEMTDDPHKKHVLMKEAEDKLMRSAKQGNNQAYYQIACFYSLNNQKEVALEWMKKARSFNVLPPTHEILEDTWLENLRSMAEFHNFIALLNDQGSEF